MSDFFDCLVTQSALSIGGRAMVPPSGPSAEPSKGESEEVEIIEVDPAIDEARDPSWERIDPSNDAQTAEGPGAIQRVSPQSPTPTPSIPVEEKVDTQAEVSAQRTQRSESVSIGHEEEPSPEPIPRKDDVIPTQASGEAEFRERYEQLFRWIAAGESEAAKHNARQVAEGGDSHGLDAELETGPGSAAGRASVHREFNSSRDDGQPEPMRKTGDEGKELGLPSNRSSRRRPDSRERQESRSRHAVRERTERAVMEEAEHEAPAAPSVTIGNIHITVDGGRESEPSSRASLSSEVTQRHPSHDSSKMYLRRRYIIPH